MLRIISRKKTFDYSSVQVNLPSDIAKKIKQWGKDNIPDADVYETDGHGRETEIHVTVKYGLHTDDVNEVKKLLSGYKQFYIELGEISRFAHPDSEYDVAKIEIISNDLHDLHAVLGDLENSDQWLKYKPHSTISYLKKGKSKEVSGNKEFLGTKILVKELTFSNTIGEKKIISLKELN